MNGGRVSPRTRSAVAALAMLVLSATVLPAQQAVTGTRDPDQQQDEDFAKAYLEWTSEARYGSPLVDHLPVAAGIPTPKDILGYHIGAPTKLTYYADILRYYRALAEASPRVTIETITPQYHLMGGLHSGETGPSEMLMELAYRLSVETSTDRRFNGANEA